MTPMILDLDAVCAEGRRRRAIQRDFQSRTTWRERLYGQRRSRLAASLQAVALADYHKSLSDALLVADFHRGNTDCGTDPCTKSRMGTLSHARVAV